MLQDHVEDVFLLDVFNPGVAFSIDIHQASIGPIPVVYIFVSGH